MKKYILILFLILNFLILKPVGVFATSGACSYHGGVNCSAGADWDGSVVCNDGWRDSSVYYSNMIECQSYQTSCPFMSTYDYLSGGCKCMSGYVVGTDFMGNQTCVSAQTKCTDLLGYGGRYNSLSNKCECSYGYLYNGSQCVSESSYCEDQLGLMSQYNSLTDKCECMTGYEFNGSSCIYKTKTYTPIYTPTYAPDYSCPLNSHTSTTDITKCSCDTGYQTNITKDACVPIPIPTKTDDQICQDSFGLNVLFTGTKNSDGTLNCNCKIGYQWNEGRTACVVGPVFPTGCTSIIGFSPTTGLSCDGTNKCSVNMQLNSDKSGCVSIPVPEKKVESKSPVVPVKGSVKNVDTVKVESKVEISPTAPTQPVPKLKWYQKIFNWF